MPVFEYIIILISIILGFGITTMLTGIANWIKDNPKELLYIPYLTWILFLFILHIHEWWEVYSYQSIKEWKLPVFLCFILYPINLYILAHLLFPPVEATAIKGKDFYVANWAKFFGVMLLLAIISIFQNIFLFGYEWTSQIAQFGLILILSFTLFTNTQKPIVHYSIAGILWILMLATMLTMEDKLVLK